MTEVRPPSRPNPSVISSTYYDPRWPWLVGAILFVYAATITALVFFA